MNALIAPYDKVSPGDYVIIDDYPSWEGCKKAIDEFRTTHTISPALHRIDQHAAYKQVMFDSSY